MQNAALERANVPERVDHRSHQRRGIEQEATVHMGPSATAMERRAERQAMREGRAYEPVTMVGQHNAGVRSEEHTSELQSLMRISYAVFCLKKKKKKNIKSIRHRKRKIESTSLVKKKQKSKLTCTYKHNIKVTVVQI